MNWSRRTPASTSSCGRPTDELLEALASNNLDIMFGRVLHARQASNLRVTKVYTESFELVCSQQHPLARKRIVGWKELAQQQWVLPATGPLREMAEDIFTARGVLRPEISVASSSFHQMRYVIAAGSLLGVLPRSIALRGKADGELALLRTGEGAKFAPISLIARKDFEQPPLVSEFEKIVLRVASKLKLR
jgi:DNA-binding transcriptional LysR family regulator